MRPSAIWSAAALALVSTAGLTTSAQAATYGTPTIRLSASYLSGAVGGTGDPTVGVTVAQSGADASALTVTATDSSKGTVAGATDVRVTGTGGSRAVAVTAHGSPGTGPCGCWTCRRRTRAAGSPWCPCPI